MRSSTTFTPTVFALEASATFAATCPDRKADALAVRHHIGASVARTRDVALLLRDDADGTIFGVVPE
jgi:hypothetical protein